jgi:hypothetical protein
MKDSNVRKYTLKCLWIFGLIYTCFVITSLVLIFLLVYSGVSDTPTVQFLVVGDHPPSMSTNMAEAMNTRCKHSVCSFVLWTSSVNNRSNEYLDSNMKVYNQHEHLRIPWYTYRDGNTSVNIKDDHSLCYRGDSYMSCKHTYDQFQFTNIMTDTHKKRPWDTYPHRTNHDEWNIVVGRDPIFTWSAQYPRGYNEDMMTFIDPEMRLHRVLLYFSPGPDFQHLSNKASRYSIHYIQTWDTHLHHLPDHGIDKPDYLQAHYDDPGFIWVKLSGIQCCFQYVSLYGKVLYEKCVLL